MSELYCKNFMGKDNDLAEDIFYFSDVEEG
jgi:hypothetical protein